MPRLIASTKNGMKLVDDVNYIYNKLKTSKNGSKQYWQCEDRLCKARVHTYVGDGDNKIVKSVGEHNHSATAVRVAHHQMKIMSESTQDTPRTIICKETQSMNVCAISELPSVSSLSRSIRRWRQVEDDVPPIPQERHGYLIPDQYCYLDNCLKWLQFDSGEHDTERILIFSTDSEISDIKRVKNWAVDGTFKCSPIIYYQLYTLHIQDNDISVPRMFTLLPNKTQDTYNILFSTIKELLHNVEPATVMMDFESGHQ
ncbi:uncharacterized protein pre-mod(mdg4)-N [Palaemon carinicauda]|uniref:uncharacterized protein pre-mod(mdg4)-N n=1 Tax=Palaemon carinicauda TaxID=392227 RepID=UPI0035B5E5D1